MVIHRVLQLLYHKISLLVQGIVWDPMLIYLAVNKPLDGSDGRSKRDILTAGIEDIPTTWVERI